jgi:hypothetical protein
MVKNQKINVSEVTYPSLHFIQTALSGSVLLENTRNIPGLGTAIFL